MSSEGNDVTDLKVYLRKASATYRQQEELSEMKKYLGKGLNSLLSSKENYFYSIPPQSVIQIGLSDYKGLNTSVKVTEYPLLIADMRAATNYFIVR